MPLAWVILIALVQVCFADETPLPPPFPLNPTHIETGDLIGVSSRRELTGFVAQATTYSPIDHVGVARKLGDAVFVYHWTKAGLFYEPLPDFLAKYRASNGEVFAMQARPLTPLTEDQKEKLFAFLANPPPEALATASCSNFVRSAFRSVRVDVGEELPVKALDTRRLGGALAEHAQRHLRDQTMVVPTISLFEIGTRLVASNTRTHWSFLEMLEAWRQTADLSKVARAYFGKKALPENPVDQFLSELHELHKKDVEIITLHGCATHSALLRMNPFRQ